MRLDLQCVCERDREHEGDQDDRRCRDDREAECGPTERIGLLLLTDGEVPRGLTGHRELHRSGG